MTTTEELPAVPSLGPLYARAAVAAAMPGAGNELPDREVVVRGVRVDRGHLAAYDRVCGFRVTDRLPPTYLHVLAFPLSVTLMAGRGFPFPLPGLVHVANRIEVRRPVDAAEAVDLAVRTVDLRPHRRGRQFDVVATVTVGDEVVWQGVSTYLRRGPGGEEAADDGREEAVPAPGSEVETARWRVPADTGRRYGAVSGDRNPIHTSVLAAKAFGFPRTIAHGMYTAARALATVGAARGEAYEWVVEFARPVVLPAEVAVRVARDGEEADDGDRGASGKDPGVDGSGPFSYAVWDPRSGRPHLTGAVTPL